MPSSVFGVRWRVVSAAVALPLIAMGLTVSQAPALATAKLQPSAAVKPTSRHTITLITGDVVTVTTLADGKQTAEVARPENATGGVHVYQVHGDVYVLPDEAMSLVAADKLDRRLFDVTDLIEMGYDDAKSASLPLIATYTPSKTRSRVLPTAPAGSRIERELASVGGAALKTDKRQTRTFWKTVAPTANGTALGAGVAKIWLDGKVKVNLKESVPQIGAPEAWAMGYTGKGVKVAVLDTGIDDTHPDLAGQVDDKKSFVPGEDTTDVHGHGTHVASTIVGTGAASNGDYRGVAPGADLIVGKVLSNEGYGDDSWIVAGMEWAARSGAKIVSMSLGDTTPSDGSDPMSLAVDNLSAQYGTLFVIAAGNAGPESIAPPGSAASALTVGAVDKQDNLAYFSSTGPLTRSGGMKPDLTAPGVDITAARSQAQPGEGMYWTISGTSMATPHVSGAAAILSQEHPDWTGQQLKQALMSSAKGLAEYYSAYEVGTGRLDVAAAVKDQVFATSGSAFFGNFTWPHDDDTPVTRAVTFSNIGGTAVTLNLAIAGSGPFSLGASSVTVPAHGTAEVDVTGDPTASDPGRFTAYLVGTDATSGKAVTRTSLGLIKEEERYDLKVKLLDRSGKPAKGTVVLNVAGDFWPYMLTVDGETTLRVPPGTYSLESILDIPGERGDRLGAAMLLAPEVIVERKSAEAVLDASKARLLDTESPARVENRQRKIAFQVTYADGYGDFSDTFMVPTMYDDLYLTPTEQPKRASLTVGTRWRQGEPGLTLSALGNLVPIETTLQPGSTRAAWAGSLGAVYAGKGSAADFAKVNAKGKLAVVTRSDDVAPDERAAAAAAAGAKLLVVVNDGPGVLNEYVGEAGIPVATVHRDLGQVLVAFAKTGILRLNAKQVPFAGYLFDLTRNFTGQVPNQALTYRPGLKDLARINASYYSPSARTVEGAGFRYDMTFTPSAGFWELESYPGTRTEWVTPGQSWHETHYAGDWEDRGHLNSYAKGTATALQWFAPAVRPAFGRGYSVANGRYRDYMTLNVQAYSPSGGVIEHAGSLGWGSTPTSLKLYQGGTLIEENEFSSDLQWVEVPSGKLPYHLVLDASRGDEWRLTTRTHTEWDFVSEGNQADNFVPMSLMQIDYALATDLSGNVNANSWQQISVKPGAQPGGGGVGKVTSVNLQVSYDDGATWSTVVLRKGADGTWTGNVKTAKKPGGFLSLKASASTDSGFGINQEIIRAYGLK